MWPYAVATLRYAWRSPLAWVLLALGAFTGWFAAMAAILALDEVGAQGQSLLIGTGQLMGILLTLWLVGRSLEEDRQSGFAAAADAARPGLAGRLLGRWLGATLAGSALSSATGLVISSSAALQSPDWLLLLSTCIMTCALAAAWGVLIGSTWQGIGATLLVFLLWVLGHLPWGVAPYLGGLVGDVVGSLLPGPRTSGSMATWGYTSAAVAGLLLVALALSRPAEA